MRYYSVISNWSRKIKPHLSDPEARAVLVRDFNRFTFGRWERPFVAGMKPTDFESCDWRFHLQNYAPRHRRASVGLSANSETRWRKHKNAARQEPLTKAELM